MRNVSNPGTSSHTQGFRVSIMLSGPLFSLLLVVLAGIALRYALWFGRDSDAPARDAEASDWAARHQAMQDAIQREQTNSVHLKTQLERVQGDYDAMRQAWDRRDVEMREQQRELREVREQLEEMQAQQAVAPQDIEKDAQTEAVTAALQEAQAELQILEEMRSQVECLTVQVQEQQRELSTCQADVVARDQSLARVEAELNRSRQQLASRDEKLAEALQTLTLLQADTRFTEDLRAEQGHLKSALHESAERLKRLHASQAQLETERDALLRENAEMRQSVRQTQQQLRQQEVELAEARKSADDYRLRSEEREKHVEHLREEVMGQYDLQLASLQSDSQQQLESLREQMLAQAAADQTELLCHLDGLKLSHQEQQEEIRALRTEKEEVTRGLHREQDARRNLQQQLDALEDRLAQFDELSLQLDELRIHASSADQRLAEVTMQSEQLEAERDTLQIQGMRAERQVEELSGSIGRLENQVAEATSQLRKNRSERDLLAAQLERERHERNALGKLVRSQSEALQQLRDESESLESLLERHAATQLALKEQADRLRHGTLARFESHTEGTTEILSLQAFDEREELRRNDPILGEVFVKPPRFRDDLTEIAGIDEAMEEKLHCLGIYLFRQIARWDWDAVAEFSQLLSCGDQITRQNWVARAAQYEDRDRRQAA